MEFSWYLSKLDPGKNLSGTQIFLQKLSMIFYWSYTWYSFFLFCSSWHHESRFWRQQAKFRRRCFGGFFLYLFVLVEMIYTVCSQGALNLLVLWMAKLDNLFLKFLVVDVKEPLGIWSFCWQLMKWGNDLPERFKCKLRNFCIFQCRKCHFKT